MLRCGVCGHKLSASMRQPSKAYRYKRPVYFCPPHRGGCGKVTAAAHGVDAELRRLVIARLSDPVHAAQVSAFTSKRAHRLNQVRLEIETCRQLQQALADRLGRQEVDLDSFDVANRPLVAKLAKLRAEKDSLESGALGPLETATRDETAAEWDVFAEAGDVDGLRAMLGRALGRHQLVIDRVRRPGPRFDPDRLRLISPEQPSGA